MKLTIIAAVAQNSVIGKGNNLPWNIPEDLKHFRQATTGKTVLMGENTYYSIVNRLKKPLPDRTNVVISRESGLKLPEGVLLFNSIDSALDALQDKEEVIVIGGGSIYAQTIDKADKLILTEVHKVADGDVFFPKVDKTVWKEISREDHLPEFSFVEYKRI